MITSKDIERLTTHELCQLVSSATFELSLRLSPPKAGLDLIPGARLAARMAKDKVGRTPDEELRMALATMAPDEKARLIAVKERRGDAEKQMLADMREAWDMSKDAGMEQAVTVDSSTLEVQTLECAECGCMWSRPMRKGRPHKLCPDCAEKENLHAADCV